PKNYDMFAILTDQQKKEVAKYKDVLNTTFDNGTCYTQIRALAIAYANIKDERYKEAAINGLQYILTAQYNNGGWPQYYPLENNYSREITFNDGAMMGIMNLLGDILVTKSPLYDFIDRDLRGQLQKSYEKGIDCILKTQIKDNGVLTAWCQQHDEKTLKPAWARKFEPPCICDGESVGIVQFLMGIRQPNQQIINAVQAAVRWFDDSKILNTRIKKIAAPPMKTRFRLSTSDRIVVIDSAAPPIWTRYYELTTHRPLFCNRDSKVVYSLDKVERERRDGYGWYTYAPQKILNEYPKWQKKWAPNNNMLK
ncbi:pectate lyase, partial [Arachidicoccus sp.]|uniref:pectate lyase n=1 Tax=Arachidicoccus sp. TaxID=1872624 RepID=UPI003D2536EF